MINRIQEETLGKIQTQDDAREGTEDDISFEFEDPGGNLTTIEIEFGFTLLDLSAFPRYSYELHEVFWNSFKDNHDNVAHHVEWFMTMASEYGIKEEEDVYMRSFVLHLGGKALTWFGSLDKGKISSFS